MNLVQAIVHNLLSFFQLLVIVHVVLSWIQIRVPREVAQFLDATVEPVLAAIRSALPAGPGGVDFSPIVAWFGALLLQGLVRVVL